MSGIASTILCSHSHPLRRERDRKPTHNHELASRLPRTATKKLEPDLAEINFFGFGKTFAGELRRCRPPHEHQNRHAGPGAATQ
jgi:hypothetical protein